MRISDWSSDVCSSDLLGSLDTLGERSTERDDERLTRVGRFIRRTSIDQLPKLFNVVLGNMSLVGPPPPAVGSRAGEQLLWSSEERRVGEACVSTCKSRWSPYH